MGTDRKRPLAAFLVVAVIAVVLLVTSVRSQAASGWLNRRLPASVVAVVPGSGESGLWHAVGDGVTQVVRHGAVLAHKTTRDASSGETTVADAPPSLRVSSTPSTPHAHPAGTPSDQAPRPHHAAHHQPIAAPGSGGPGGSPARPAQRPGDGGCRPGRRPNGSGSRHHGRDHGDDGDHGPTRAAAGTASTATTETRASTVTTETRATRAPTATSGDQGSSGDQSDQGDQGSSGDQGDQGDQESSGDQGDQGFDGDQGDGRRPQLVRWPRPRPRPQPRPRPRTATSTATHGHGKHLGWSS